MPSESVRPCPCPRLSPAGTDERGRPGTTQDGWYRLRQGGGRGFESRRPLQVAGRFRAPLSLVVQRFVQRL